MQRTLLLFVFGASFLFAQSDRHCVQVGGAISTNFLDPTTTFGTATGDLKGAVGVTVLSLTHNPDGSLTFLDQHHWVTESGDTINLNPAPATGFPTPVPGLYAASYLQGVNITGGTGRFAEASGKLAIWGAVDIQNNEVVLRYEGKVCFGPGAAQ